MTHDEIINPPLIGVKDTDALCPPMDPAAYAKWIGDNREALGMNRIIRTAATERAEHEVQQAFRLIAQARADLTIGEFEEFIRSNLSDLGGGGFVASIGEAIQHAAVPETADDD